MQFQHHERQFAQRTPKTPFVMVSLFLLLVWNVASSDFINAQSTKQTTVDGEQRLVRYEGNLLVDPVEGFLAKAKQAKAEGANTVLFSDPKINLWFADPALAKQWRPNMEVLAKGVRELGMKLVLQTTPLGYCTPLLFSDPNLTTGYPIVSASLVARNAELVAEQTATLLNGSFESAALNVPANWGFQDAPGTQTFLDSTVHHEGSTSLRFEGKGATNGQARIFTSATVKPFHQYSLRFWIRAQNLTAGFLGPIVSSTDDKTSLTSQHYSFRENTTRTYVSEPKNLTKDWTEISVSFNSLDQTKIRLGFGVWDATEGMLWVDDVRLIDTPLLNIIRRKSLPAKVLTLTGRQLREGTDYSKLIDTKLGQSGYPGNFDTYHEAPAIAIPKGSSIKEGDRVAVDGYHAMVTTAGQVGCSWHEEQVFARMKKVHAQAEKAFQADGYLIDFEEVRTGGWEPADREFPSSGAALSAHIQRAVRDAKRATGKPIYVWSDMLEPTANAVADFYQVRGSLDRAWEGLDPKQVIIVNWKDGNEADKAKASVEHFAKLGFQQVIAGFYDRNVGTNYNVWKKATAGQRGVIGSMYTTWVSDYSQLPNFAKLWWKPT
jgi:Carbohydrate binding domain